MFSLLMIRPFSPFLFPFLSAFHFFYGRKRAVKKRMSCYFLGICFSSCFSLLLCHCCDFALFFLICLMTTTYMITVCMYVSMLHNSIIFDVN
mmetsp:Transcript_28853/g.73998  ORF Transcript_28853/g.73998 Transcript_28853/m.73998 type:complete len:92 (+) Transcript_28853:1508-1783(+)